MHPVRASLALALVASIACSDPAPTPAPPLFDPALPQCLCGALVEDGDLSEGCRPVSAPPSPGRVQLTQVFAQDLAPIGAFASPTHLQHSPETPGRWYLSLHDGQIVTFTEGGKDARVFLDLGDKVWLETFGVGLVSFAFHPDFERNRQVYVFYGTDGGTLFTARLSRFTSPDGLIVDPDSEEVILDLDQDSIFHSQNHIAFGPDGFLYAAYGDDFRQKTNAQDTQNILGTIVRIDVNNTDDDRGTPYAIPADNPFAQGGGAPEIFAYGLRNPWRFAFDSQTGQIYAGDVGDNTREEIDLVILGGNYGWPVKEGIHCYDNALGVADPDLDCDDTGMVAPLVDYSRVDGSSVTAGHVYRGRAIPDMVGRYVYTDFISGVIWSIDPNQPDTIETVREFESGFQLASMAEGPDGELYAINFRGDKIGVHRLDPAPEGGVDLVPRTLSGTGCVTPSDPRTPADDFVPYTPSAKLWSDGAFKERAVWIPTDTGGTVTVGQDGNLSLPIGSVLLKHFGFDDALHETRLLIHHPEGWRGYSYAWNEAQTDAVRLDVGQTATLDNGLLWQFPSSNQCLQCHTEAAGFTLGLELGLLDHVPEGAQQNPLDAMAKAGHFGPSVQNRGDIDQIDAREPMPDPFGDAPLALRARAYLHANCAGCHRPQGPSQVVIDLRYTTPLSGMKACNIEPEKGSTPRSAVPRDDQRLIIPGNPEGSLIALRMRERTRSRMPPLGVDLLDDEGRALIGAWIESLEDCSD